MNFSQKLDKNWMFYSTAERISKTAIVPGCIHLDLLKHGIIDDPYYRDNEAKQQWVSRTDWIYECKFIIPREIIDEYNNFTLRCDGLDTLCEVKLNGVSVGKADNMHRCWKFPIENALRSGENTLEVIFESPVNACEEKQAKFPLNSNKYSPFSPEGKSHLRKEMANFGWDWGPCLITSGIWRDIYVEAWKGARINDVHFSQKHSKDSVELKIHTDIMGSYQGMTVSGEILSEKISVAAGDEITFEIPDPKLWWPNGMGEQHLYTIKIELKNSEGQLIDSLEKQIGLRTIELVRDKDEWGESFYFKVNGQKFFAKGANWIPPDTFAPLVDAAWRQRLLEDSRDANMNMIRVWGGGVYEEDDFYDCCDKLGLMVWQDIMFACAAYPADDEFLDNVEKELDDNVKRLRHHPCIALWCGNNELEQRLYKPGKDWPELPPREYEKIFDRMIPDYLSGLSNDIPYWPCSPHSPVGPRSDHNNQSCGDTHLWNVWHHGEPFEWYLSSRPRFCSEFGFQSFPDLSTIKKCTAENDRFVNSRIMEYHQRSRIGNKAIIQYMADWLPLTGDFEDTIIASQILQGISMKFAIEQWRRNMPCCMGALYWQLNDCWPGPSWSTIDWELNRKASYYFVKRAFAPEMVSIVADSELNKYAIHLCNDNTEEFSGQLIWSLTDTNGKLLSTEEMNVKIPPSASLKLKELDMADHDEKSICWCKLIKDGEILSSDFASFEKPKDMHVANPELDIKIKEDGSSFIVDIMAMTNTFWTFIELDDIQISCSDNFFSMRSGEMRRIEISPGKSISEPEFIEKLKVKTLYDFFNSTLETTFLL